MVWIEQKILHWWLLCIAHVCMYVHAGQNSEEIWDVRMMCAFYLYVGSLMSQGCINKYICVSCVLKTIIAIYVLKGLHVYAFLCAHVQKSGLHFLDLLLLSLSRC